jgi:uncharacterized tellurite resistance protein B-like protein|tara:strand:- start:464 stop:916 length:453 start_codon:yes stop_codon:yes gene_type:complete
MILNLFDKKNNNTDNDESIDYSKIIALLVHAAKIDENYTEKERKIIFNFVEIFTKNQKKTMSKNEILDLIKDAEDYEKNSNQILEYTREVKKMDIKIKTLILEALWGIILSDEKSGVYESNLMRRICGLLYFPDKLSGEIKLNILKRKKL